MCGANAAESYFQDARRDYYRCRQCGLVFVPPHACLSPTAEKAEYDLHENSVDDPGYRDFLSRLFTPMVERLPQAARGLDFGCGPGPALAAMFTEAGHDMALYDCFYADDKSVLERRYDFITATEVVEHLQRPGAELERLWHALEPGGWLGLMTKLVLDRDAFSRWHYKNDLTHVCFFSQEAFAWLAQHWGTRAEIIGRDVIILQKP